MNKFKANIIWYLFLGNLLCCQMLFGQDFPSRSEIENHISKNWISGKSLEYRINLYLDEADADSCRNNNIRTLNSLIDSKFPFLYIEEYGHASGLVGSILVLDNPTALIAYEQLSDNCLDSFVLLVENDTIWNFISNSAEVTCGNPVSFGFNSTRMSLCSLNYYDGVSFSYTAFEMPWRVGVSREAQPPISSIGKDFSADDALIIVQSYRFLELCRFLDNMLGEETFVSSRRKSAELIFNPNNRFDFEAEKASLSEGSNIDWSRELLKEAGTEKGVERRK